MEILTVPLYQSSHCFGGRDVFDHENFVLLASDSGKSHQMKDIPVTECMTKSLSGTNEKWPKQALYAVVGIETGVEVDL